MKKTSFVLFFIIASILTTISAKEVQGTEITPLEISDVKWVYVKFNADVNYADRGTDDIKIEMTKSKSILRIKSETVDFDPTTITVITNDGVVHTFSLSYKQDPTTIAINKKGSKIEEDDIIQPYRIELSEDRTSHIILPEKVIDVAVGSQYIAAQQAEDINNIVKCKSIDAGFDIYSETSLTIVTSNDIYPFIATYNKNPKMINITVGGTNGKQNAVFDRISANETDMKVLGEKVISKGCVINNIGVIESKMTFALSSIYINDDVMMFNISMANRSNIDYDIDFIKCYIVNKKTTKAETYQIDEKNPLYTFCKSDENVVKTNGTYTTVFFYKKFTIPSKHVLYFEVFEKNGGRHMKFTVPYKELLNAKSIK